MSEKKQKKSRLKKTFNDKHKKVNASDRKNTSLRLDNAVLKRLKIRAIEEDSSVQGILEKLVYQYLEKDA